MDKEPLGAFIDELDGVPKPSDGGTGGSTNTAGDDGNAAPGSGSGGNAGEWIAGFEAVEPTELGDAAGSGAGKRRGRPRGSRNAAPGTAPKKANLAGVEGILLSIHAIAAGLISVPELRLNPEEAKQYGDAIRNVSAQYDHRIDPKTMAWVQLALVTGTIYGGRIVLYYKRRAAEEKQQNGGNPPRPFAVPNPPKPKAEQSRTEPERPVNGATNPHELFGMYGLAVLTDAV